MHGTIDRTDVALDAAREQVRTLPLADLNPTLETRLVYAASRWFPRLTGHFTRRPK